MTEKVYTIEEITSMLKKLKNIILTETDIII